ncbi:hypothetical protein CSA37_09880 [Candidatus Fermentibacteria bacterium]|nr:MAG: hypothetical protein CSA37_09880 [Candidatus Fermentibacteria bacterium]
MNPSTCSRGSFSNIAEYYIKMEVQEYASKGVSHMYGVWCFCSECYYEDRNMEDMKKGLHSFYKQYFGKREKKESIIEYKNSMSSNTKSKTQRTRRKNAIKKYIVENK